MAVAVKDALQIKVGQRITVFRKLRSISIRKFALLADIEHHQLINIEKGRVDIRLSTLQKIALALGISIGALFDETD
jgi:transcriptional regulator with XRE-family HTH domain